MTKLLEDPLFDERLAFRILVDVSDVVIALGSLLPQNVRRLVGDAIVIRAIVRVIVCLGSLRERLVGVYYGYYPVFLTMKDDCRETLLSSRATREPS